LENKDCQNLTKEKLTFVNSLINTLTLIDTVIGMLVSVDEMLARIVIQDVQNINLQAYDDSVKQKIKHELSQAQQAYKMALKCTTEGKFAHAIQCFKVAWHHAQNALMLA